MKKTLLLFSFLIATAWCSIHAQINIPDANFKAYLVGDPTINTNGDSEISVAEAQAFSGELLINGLTISDLTGIEEFINITRLDCYNNNLTSLDVSNNLALTRLHCANNQITTIDVSGIPTLNQIHCQNNQLIELNLANGNNANFSYMKSYGNPNLTCIQHDASFTPPFTNAGQYANGWTKDVNSSYSSNCNYEPVYVDANASGANNGSSWTDAFTTIDAALVGATPNSKLWVAKGVYKPTAKNTPLEINDTSVAIYGGFDGTETQLSDRDLSLINTTNATIITGDMNGDDIDGDFTSNKSDNADRLILVDATNITIDGFILENIYDTSSNANNQDNGVIYSRYSGASTWIENLSIKNCSFKNNYSNDFLIKGFGLKDNFKLYNVSFTNNISTGQSIILLLTDRFNNIFADFSNVLFADNQTKFSVINAYRIPDGSFTNFSDLDLIITNSSFINNNVVNVNNTSFGQAIIMGSDNTRGHLEINNSIFFGNTLNGAYADRDISYGTQGNHYELVINNSITQITNNGGASGAFAAPSFTNVQDLDPNTVSLNLSADYKPTTSSSYVLDNGENTFYNTALFGDFDLSGNNRIFNSTIDLGAHEYVSTLSVAAVSLSENSIKLYPNPVIDVVNIKTNQTIENVSVFNVNGQKVLEIANQSQINISNLPIGMYFLNINTNQSNQTIKILKQ
ncbi:T9SS type A sorting domain-containing protein [Olleya marilimosa]|uniref:T9SS type A sorting domain-containing protein n=1 Tax=Olleya marilimosa TaxID=272164 RepID=A0ABR8LW62_9FLAO|nr:T9SS type A sorting domain-containing protein [Olleya marilimosa]MBD3863836.1 T9SS type A sorting domain-containing protein [Olleya marilimosa]MBD3891027.1 T9SS type A sorting domain-containing protein [Olleya marilimosa]